MANGAGSASVEPADVLLFHGNSFVSWAIRRFDGSDVNHAAIAIDHTTMIEAAGHGLQTKSISEAIGSNERTCVRRLTDAGDLSPVVAKANWFLAQGVPYAYQQLLLLASLAVSRKLPLQNRLLRRVLRVALDRAAQLLNAIVDRGDDTMICSEYVFRCFQEAGDPGFGLEILPPDQRPQALAPRPGEERLLDWAEQQPAPAPAPQATGAGAPLDPDAIARESQAELEPLIAAYAQEDAPDDPEVTLLAVAPVLASLEPEVSDEELSRATVAFRDAVNAQAESTGLTVPGALSADPWALFSSVADFVTPGDLLYSPSLKDIATLP